MTTIRRRREHANEGSLSGVKGVYAGDMGKWRAMIRIHGKTKHLGSFSTKEEARAAYLAAEKEVFGEPIKG